MVQNRDWPELSAFHAMSIALFGLKIRGLGFLHSSFSVGWDSSLYTAKAPIKGPRAVQIHDESVHEIILQLDGVCEGGVRRGVDSVILVWSSKAVETEPYLSMEVRSFSVRRVRHAGHY